MPRKAGQPSKSAAIREMLARNPKTPAKEIVSAMAAKGMSVSPNLVYLIKAKGGAARRKLRRQAAARVTGQANPVELVRKVKALAGEADGMSKLKDLVVVLAE